MLDPDLYPLTNLIRRGALCSLMDAGVLAAIGGGGSTAFIIPQSIRFNDDDSAYMHFTPSVAGNLKTGTFRCYLKLSNLDTHRGIYCAYGGSANNYADIRLNADNAVVFDVLIASTTYQWTGDARLRDIASHGELVVGWDTTATTGNRLTVEYSGITLTGSWGTEIPLNRPVAKVG